MGKQIYSPHVLTPDEIITRLPMAFEEGIGGELFFYDSTTRTCLENGIEYEIRKCPALREKSVNATSNSSATLPHAKSDPFESPYSKDLLVGELHGEDNSKYIVMLNKYSIVRHHFLLITKGGQALFSFDHKPTPFYRVHTPNNTADSRGPLGGLLPHHLCVSCGYSLFWILQLWGQEWSEPAPQAPSTLPGTF